ncbi:MAG: SLC13 family permease [Nitrospirae bacterium]|nr:SLC13 family permease [Nitrospirota bacterium]
MEIALVLGILCFAVLFFSFEILPIEIISITIMLLLILTGILTPKEAFSGFGNEALIMIAGVLVLSGGMIQTGVADQIGHTIHRLARRNHQKVMLIFLGAVCSVSAFINNVAATAMMLPAAMAVARKTRSAPSRILMPIAFASMMGGTCTLIGTSTNVAVSGMLPHYDMAPLTLFELTPLGVVVSIVGVLYFAVIGYRFLPDRRGELVDDFQIREYLTEVVVLKGSPLVGKNIEESHFGTELDLNVVGILRDGNRILAPDREVVIREGDLLLMEGNAEEIHRIQKVEGVQIKADVRFHDNTLTSDQVKMVELSLPSYSDLLGRTLKEVNFRGRYGMNALAVYRKGETLRDKVGKIVLRFGDVLLVQGERRRIDVLRDSSDFILLGEVTPFRHRQKRSLPALIIFGGAIVAGGTGLLSPAVAFVTGAVLMVLSRCLALEDAYKSLDLRLILLIAGMFSLGMAMEKSGAAAFLAKELAGIFLPYGTMALLAAFFLLTVILTQPMSNVTAALLILPVAIHAALDGGIDPRPFAIAVTVAASCSFITPFEPACVLVYGPGRYRFLDFLKNGFIPTMLVFAIAMLMIPRLWPF